jgi:preprotein translocase subunit SecY
MTLGLGRPIALAMGALVVYAVGNGIPIPGIDLRTLEQLVGGSLRERLLGIVPGVLM